MRPKVAIGILVCAVGLLALIIFASKTFRPQPAAVAENVSATAPVTASTTVATVPAAGIPAADPMPIYIPPPPIVTNDPAAHAKYVKQRTEELNDLAMNNDTDSRDAILAELRTNSDKQIRAAALEAAIQFDDRSVVPQLQQIADETEDPDEKADILAAIDYINLPSLTEYLADHPAPAGTPIVRQPPRQRIHRPQAAPTSQ
ncbi:MAG TPA: hypothetical protein VIK59_08275 [Verrucomicrobiae bacterium]